MKILAECLGVALAFIWFFIAGVAFGWLTWTCAEWAYNTLHSLGA